MRYSEELACFSTKEIKSEPLIKTHAMFDFDTKKKKKDWRGRGICEGKEQVFNKV